MGQVIEPVIFLRPVMANGRLPIIVRCGRICCRQMLVKRRRESQEKVMACRPPNSQAKTHEKQKTGRYEVKKIIVAFLMITMVLGAASAFAATEAGDAELGVQFSFMDMSGDNADAEMALIAGKFGWFLSDELSLGMTASGVSISFDDGDVTQLFFELEPNYHFNTTGSVVPYAGIHAGLSIAEGNGYDSNDFSYGLQGGIKSFLNDNAALDTQLRYTATDIDGNDVDIFELRVGLNIYF
jgi:hypothetical protein